MFSFERNNARSSYVMINILILIVYVYVYALSADSPVNFELPESIEIQCKVYKECVTLLLSLEKKNLRN